MQTATNKTIYIYHIHGKKVGLSVNGDLRVKQQLDSDNQKWNILETIPSNTISIEEAVLKELEWAEQMDCKPDHLGHQKFTNYIHQRWDKSYNPPERRDTHQYYQGKRKTRPIWFDGHIYASRFECAEHCGYAPTYIQNLVTYSDYRAKWLPRWNELPLSFKGTHYQSIDECAHKTHHNSKTIWNLVISGELADTFLYPITCPMIWEIHQEKVH